MLEREGHSGAAIRQKSFDAPDEVRRFPKGIVTLVRVGSLTIGRGVLEPGFRWSTSLKPIQGTPSCQIHHLQLLLPGRFHVEMDNGETAEIGPGDVFDVPPGHDVWVVGDEPVVVVDVFGNIGAIGVPGEHERLVTTLLMSDIVDSTRTATRLGDAAWKQVLAEHNRIIRTQFDRFRGREVNTTGDGFLATFGSAAVAGSAGTAASVAVAGSVGTVASTVVAGSAGTVFSAGVFASALTALGAGVAWSAATLLCRNCRGCVGCVACVDCVDCVGCVGCVGLRGAAGAVGRRRRRHWPF